MLNEIRGEEITHVCSPVHAFIPAAFSPYRAPLGRHEAIAEGKGHVPMFLLSELSLACFFLNKDYIQQTSDSNLSGNLPN